MYYCVLISKFGWSCVQSACVTKIKQTNKRNETVQININTSEWCKNALKINCMYSAKCVYELHQALRMHFRRGAIAMCVCCHHHVFLILRFAFCCFYSLFIHFIVYAQAHRDHIMMGAISRYVSYLCASNTHLIS